MTARRERKHAPARKKAAEAQKAALPPANDASSQAAAAQVGKMDAQKPGEFDKKAFIAAVEKAVTAATPGSLKEATEFKESGKAGQVKGQVAGMVGADKQKAEKGIKDKTKEPPDPSVAVAKPVTPMPTEQPGGAPGSIGAAAAMPEKRPASETDLRSGPAEVKNEMAEAEVTEGQLREANEPEFEQAVDAKKEAEVHSKTAPAAYRAEEAETLGGAKAEAAGTERKQLAGMHQKRSTILGRVQAGKATTKSQDEIKRAEVATKIDGIFAKTKSEVTTILDGIEAKMTPIFEGGEKSARATFEALVSQRMRAYKKKRYSGIRGKARWIRDKFRSLPSVVNQFYEEGKRVYIGLMTKVISRVADVVGAELTRAKTRIAQGRAEVKTYVDGLPKNLKKVGREAQEKIGDQFDSLDSDVADKQNDLVTSLADKYKEARGALDERIEALQEENKGLIDKAIDAVKGVIKTIMKLKDMLLGVLARAVNAIGSIIAHPIRFLGNFVSAVKSGVMLFKDNILTHLAKGLMGWLFGEIAKTGIELPKSFDLKGILGLILQILGLTWANIRSRAVAMVGEKVVGRMEQGVEVFKVLVTEGPAGLWQFIKDKVGDLKEAIIGPMKDFVLTKVIVAGVTWLISLLNPASAFVKACKAIYDIVMFFVERAAQIKAFVDSVLDSIEAIAAGGVGGVAKLIEDSLAKMIPVVISFLAALLGVSGIGDKIRSVISAIQKPVNRAIDFVLKGAVKLGKKLFGGAKALFSKGKAWVKGKAEAGKKWVKAKSKAAKDWVRKKTGQVMEVLRLRRPFQAAGKKHQIYTEPGSDELVVASRPQTLRSHPDPGVRAAYARYLVAIRAATSPTGKKDAANLHLPLITAEVTRWMEANSTDDPGASAPHIGEVNRHSMQKSRLYERGIPVWYLESEHVVPRSMVSRAFEALNQAGVPGASGDYNAMHTVMVYKGAADLKTDDPGADQEKIIAFKGVMTELVEQYFLTKPSQRPQVAALMHQAIVRLTNRFAQDARARLMSAITAENSTNGAKRGPAGKPEPIRPGSDKVDSAYNQQMDTVGRQLQARVDEFEQTRGREG